jgi:hypothetical protein
MYAVKCNACPTSAHQSRELLRFDIERDQRDGLLQLYADAEVAITTAGKCLAPWLTHQICMPQAN